MPSSTKKPIKCVVWDLDNTLWDGILAEGDKIALKPGITEIIVNLDQRGILQSIASKNDADLALKKLEEFGLTEYFLYPQISWGAKTDALTTIASRLNIGLDSLALIDDSPYERAAVSFSMAPVRCIDAADYQALLDRPEIAQIPGSSESRLRRQQYLADIARQTEEANFSGSNEQFQASLGMVLRIDNATRDDLDRASELTLRTNQLNTTGVTYGYDELLAMIGTKQYQVLICQLTDRLGDYGKIGLAVIEKSGLVWNIKLLLMSCRVMGRGVGNLLLRAIILSARQHHVRLQADFLPTERNRMMYITLKFAGFEERERSGERIVLEHNGQVVPEAPAAITVHQPILNEENAPDDGR